MNSTEAALLVVDDNEENRYTLMRRLNRVMVRETSIGVNTFPSGHVAGALATAIAVGEVSPELTLWFLTAAALITLASVLGRYHYAADAAAGALVTLTAWGLVRGIWG